MSPDGVPRASGEQKLARIKSGTEKRRGRGAGGEGQQGLVHCLLLHKQRWHLQACPAAVPVKKLRKTPEAGRLDEDLGWKRDADVVFKNV